MPRKIFDSQDTEQLLCELWDSGKSASEIAVRFSCSASTIRDNLRRLGKTISVNIGLSESGRRIISEASKKQWSFVASVPAPGSAWVWADPGHTRTITPETILFLDQNHYATQVGVSPSSDYRSVWKGNLKTIWWNIDENHFTFVLRKTATGALEDTQNSQEG